MDWPDTQTIGTTEDQITVSAGKLATLLDLRPGPSMELREAATDATGLVLKARSGWVGSAKALDLQEVYREYGAYVAAIGNKLLGDFAEVDDFVQDVFMDVADGLGSLRDPEALKGWVAVVAVRKARRYLRRRILRRRLFIDSSKAPPPRVSNTASPEQRYILLSCYEALDTVPANQRLAWILRVVEGESLSEVARLCECSLATAKRRVAAANSVVRKHVGGPK